jgi:hypothetical protein
VEHVLRSSGLLRMEASRARVSQFDLKLEDVRWTTSDSATLTLSFSVYYALETF